MNSLSFFEESPYADDDVVVLLEEELSCPTKRPRCGRRASKVWADIVPFNPSPNGDHSCCQCRHCLTVFNHPIKRRASRMEAHLEKCLAYQRSKLGASSLN